MLNPGCGGAVTLAIVLLSLMGAAADHSRASGEAVTSIEFEQTVLDDLGIEVEWTGTAMGHRSRGRSGF